MSRESTPTSPIPSPNPQNDTQCPQNETTTTDNTTPSPMPVPINRSNRPSRACTIRTAQRLQAAAQAQAQAVSDRKPRKKELRRERLEEPPEDQQQCSANSKIVTPLVGSPPPSQQTRWSLRAMWELASILNFLHVFRQLLNISAEFTAEEFETALINPNDTLSDIHMPILKAIPPVTRMALTRDTWITVLCRKLRDWWHWVAEGDLPIVASHGTEIEVYKTLDPAVRVVILKALCDIRVEQDDIKSYIDKSVKHGVHLSAFRKERIGGDSFGINYWYEDDPVIGHRLYREIRKGEVKKAKVKGSNVLPNITYQWETVATNLEEFLDVSEKLFSSKNRTEASLGKKLKNDMLPEIEKEHKRKEKLLKKQQRQALLLDNFLVDGLGPGRSLRDRKPVTYTFDDYDRSINEAIKITKRKPPSPDPMQREGVLRHEASTNGKWSDPLHANDHVNFSALSPDSQNYDDADEENDLEPTDRSHRRRRRPQRYSVKEFVEAVSDNEADFDSDDDIVGEVVYDEEYLRKRKQRRKFSSSSEGDEEYNWDEENGEEEEEEEEEDSLSVSEESDDEPRKFKKLRGRTRRETKLKSVGELQSGLRRSKRATRTPINYRQYEMSESDTESARRGRPKSNVSDERSEASENEDYSEGSHDSNGNNVDEDQDMKIDFQPDDGKHEAVEQEQTQPPEQSSNPARELNSSPGREEVEGVKQRRFLDLNELAPASGFDDGPNTVKDENTDNF